MKHVIDKEIKEKIKQIPFFESCGDNISYSFEHQRVVSWDEASVFFCSDNWEYETAEKANELSDYLFKNNFKIYQNWNDYVDDAKYFIECKLKREMEIFCSKKSLDAIFLDCVNWDILHVIMYLQYAKLVGRNLPNFYGYIYEIYSSGHYPCDFDNDNNLFIII